MAQQRRDADRILEEAIAYTRSLVAQLTPPILLEFGLVRTHLAGGSNEPARPAG